VAIFFSGISSRRYIVPNISDTTKTNAETIFKTAAYISECCIFLELGLSVFGLPAASFNWPFIGWAFVASLIGRAIGIYPIVFVFNMTLKETVPVVSVDPSPLAGGASANVVTTLPVVIGHNKNYNDNDDDTSVQSCDSWSVSSAESSRSSGGGQRKRRRLKRKRKTPEKRKDKQISMAIAHVLWFAGLRGAVAYACVRKFPNLYGHADEFTATTMVIVLVSLIVMGGLTESVLRALNIQMDVDEERYMKEWHEKRALKGCFHDLGKLFI